MFSKKTTKINDFLADFYKGNGLMVRRRRKRKRTLFQNPITVKDTVKTVIDGDTLRLKRGRRIRLVGIDCPELTSPRFFGGRRYNPESLAIEAKDYLKSLLEGKKIELDFIGRDVYGRTLAHVRFDGQDITIKLLEEGLGWAKSWEWEHLRAQWQAQRNRKGIWATQKGLGLVAGRSPGNFLLALLARLRK
jgi:endonuclease YncB( thermonuclease family)